MNLVPRRLIAGAAVFALVATACSSGGGSSPSAASSSGGGAAASSSSAASASTSSGGGGSQNVTITWWHNANQDPGKAFWQKIADDYSKAHPGVKFQIQAMQNEDFKTKIPLALNSSTPPELFQSWGGGGMKQQVQAGKLQDITSAVADIKDTILKPALDLYQIDGKQYGLPYDLGLVGFWYNKDLFTKAGISSPPTTWSDFLSDVQKLKAAGVAPIALGEKDKWPGAFWWEYLGLRECGADKMKASVQNNSFQDQCWVKAGDDLKKLIDMQPFNPGFMSTPAQTGATSASGLLANQKAAIELQGQWEPSVVTPLTANGKGLGDKLGWFPFPTVTGAPGVITDFIGGGNGFAVAKDAPPAAVDFLKYLVSKPIATERGKLNDGVLPTTNGAESAVTDPSLQTLIQQRSKATFVQLYLDQAFSASVGNAINDAVAGEFAGQFAPQDVQSQVQQATKQG